MEKEVDLLDAEVSYHAKVSQVHRALLSEIFVRLSDAFVGKQMRANLGLSHIELLLTGSAPTQAYIKRFLLQPVSTLERSTA